MNNWKISLDKYLTTEPYDEFQDWVEDLVGNQLSDSFFNDNEDWIEVSNIQFNAWAQRLFMKGKSPKEAAAIIEKAHSKYIAK
jgi:hypothetical protein